MTRKFKEHDQLDLFGQSLPDFKPKGKLRLIELFAGIGAQSKALENLGVDFASQRVCEWSWKSIIGYNAIHKRDFSDHSEGMSVDDLVKATEGISNDYSNPMTEAERKRKGEAWLRRVYSSMVAIGDTVPSITMLRGSDLGIERERERVDTYAMTYSFPCQDLSNAGRMKGMERGSGTRSGLLWEVERILLELRDMECRPDVLLMENVPGVCGTANIGPWNEWLKALEGMGYTNHWKVLNAKDFGIPQNRQRCFMVSLLGNFGFTFPRPMPLRHRLRDFLDADVEGRYYLPDKVVADFIERYHEKLPKGLDDEPNGFLPIPSNNKKGYEPARDGDGCLPTWKGARGTAQGGMSPTLLTDGNTVGVVSLEIVGMVNEGGYKRNNEVLGGGGVSPTICARDFRGPVMVLEDKGNGRKD